MTALIVLGLAAALSLIAGGDEPDSRSQEAVSRDDEPSQPRESGPQLSGSARSPEAIAAARRRRAARAGGTKDDARLPICAYVVDPDGRPLPGVEVVLHHESADWTLRRASTTSSESGSPDAAASGGVTSELPKTVRPHRVTSGPQGELRARLEGGGTEYRPVAVSPDLVLVTPWGEGEVFWLGKPPARIVAWPKLTITGRVIDESNRPVADAEVVVVRWNDRIARHVHKQMAEQEASFSASAGAGDSEQAAATDASPENGIPDWYAQVLAPPRSFPELRNPTPSQKDTLNVVDDSEDPERSLAEGLRYYLAPFGYMHTRRVPMATVRSNAQGEFQAELRGDQGQLRTFVVPDPLGTSPHAGCRVEFEQIPVGPITLRVDTGRTMEVHVQTSDGRPVPDAAVLLLEAPDELESERASTIQRSWSWLGLAELPLRAGRTLADGSARIERLSDSPYWIYAAATDQTGFSRPTLAKATSPRAVITVPGLVTYRGQLEGPHTEGRRILCTVQPPGPASCWPSIARRELTPDPDGTYAFEAPSSTRVEVFAFDLKTGESASLDVEHTTGDVWLGPAGTFELRSLKLEPPRVVRLELPKRRQTDDKRGYPYQWPRGSVLVIKGHASQSEIHLEIDEKPGDRRIRLPKAQEYTVEIRTPGDQAVYELRYDFSEHGTMLLNVWAGRRREADGTWRRIDVSGPDDGVMRESSSAEDLPAAPAVAPAGGEAGGTGSSCG